MRKTSRPTLMITLLLICGAASLGCDHPIEEPEARRFVDRWAETVPESLDAEGSQEQPGRLRTAIEHLQKMEKLSDQDSTPIGQLVFDDYQSRKFETKLVEKGDLNERGSALVETLLLAENHALETTATRLGETKNKLAALQELDAAIDLSELQPSVEDKDQAVALLTAMTHEAFPLTDEQFPRLTRLIVEAKESRLQAAVNSLREKRDRRDLAAMDLEAALAFAMARYGLAATANTARDIFVHPRIDDVFNDPEVRKRRPDKAKGAHIADHIWRRSILFSQTIAAEPKHRPVMIQKWMEKFFAADNQKWPGALESIWPSHPQYTGLVAERKRYRTIVENGGWEKVPVRKNLRVGAESKVVEALRKRLAAEGYLEQSETHSARFDEDLKAAVIDYQKTHQMKSDGKLHRVFWKSVNVPAEKRMAQIDLNLKRWRYSNVDHRADDSYVFVNVPDFHVEVWRRQKREMRFEIVVGNNDIVEDKEIEESFYANRTPVPIAAYIDRAIYNPFWNVTPRIRQEEVIPEVRSALLDKYRTKLGLVDPPTPDPPEGTEIIPPSPKAEKARKEGETLAQLREISATMEETEFFRDYPYFNKELGDIDVNTTQEESIPAWYAANNYEVMYPGKRWEYVRMTPGTHNALGLVKIIFPNRHDVYFHDTNAKALFSRPLRAFSHGCMRLKKPLEFAEHLLDHDGLYDKSHAKQVLKSGDYDAIFLKRKVPVFVEYFTVRTDETGRANFLADIYGYDRQGWISGPVKRKVD
jgi:L,D-transpeptidase YcbB